MAFVIKDEWYRHVAGVGPRTRCPRDPASCCPTGTVGRAHWSRDPAGGCPPPAVAASCVVREAGGRW
jgi:hypothetical protein